MTPYKQLGPDDCFRTVIASLLDIGPIAVPHFFADHDAAEGFEHLNKWLAGHGLTYIEFAWPGSIPLAELLGGLASANPDRYFIVGGYGVGDNHVVIARNGIVVCDPSWSNRGLTGPNSEGVWTIGILAGAVHK